MIQILLSSDEDELSSLKMYNHQFNKYSNYILNFESDNEEMRYVVTSSSTYVHDIIYCNKINDLIEIYYDE